MTEARNPKQYDLETRTIEFARRVYKYVNALSKTIPNVETGRQLVRATGSVGANYIEANEALSRKDFLMRVKISRKEAKESRYWIGLTEPAIVQREGGKIKVVYNFWFWAYNLFRVSDLEFRIYHRWYEV